MKKSFLLNCLLLTGGIALVVACVFQGGGCAIDRNNVAQPVVITKKRIILSGAQISKDDQKAINNILTKCNDTSLYKIQAFYKGELQGPPQGTMGEQFLDVKMVSTMTAYMKKHKLSGKSFALDGTSSGPGARCDGEELVKRLTPIFKKYSR